MGQHLNPLAVRLKKVLDIIYLICYHIHKDGGWIDISYSRSTLCSFK